MNLKDERASSNFENHVPKYSLVERIRLGVEDAYNKAIHSVSPTSLEPTYDWNDYVVLDTAQGKVSVPRGGEYHKRYLREHWYPPVDYEDPWSGKTTPLFDAQNGTQFISRD